MKKRNLLDVSVYQNTLPSKLENRETIKIEKQINQAEKTNLSEVIWLWEKSQVLLIQNWVKTKEQLLSLSEEQLDSFNIPFFSRRAIDKVIKNNK